MALKKTLASYRLPDGTWHPQEDIEMGPFEEAAILADWERGELKVAEPKPYTVEEEMKIYMQAKPGVLGMLQDESKEDYLEKKKQERQTEIETWNIAYSDKIANCEQKWQLYKEEMAKLPLGTKTC